MLNRFERLSAGARVSSLLFLFVAAIALLHLLTVDASASARAFFIGLLLVPALLYAAMLAQCLVPKKDPRASFGVVAASCVGIVWVLFLFGV